MFQERHKINFYQYRYSEKNNLFYQSATIQRKILNTAELKIVTNGQQKLPRFIINIVIITIANRLKVAVNSHRTLSHCSHTQTAQRINIRYTKRLTLINLILTASKSMSNNHT